MPIDLSFHWVWGFWGFMNCDDISSLWGAQSELTTDKEKTLDFHNPILLFKFSHSPMCVSFQLMQWPAATPRSSWHWKLPVDKITKWRKRSRDPFFPWAQRVLPSKAKQIIISSQILLLIQVICSGKASCRVFGQWLKRKVPKVSDPLLGKHLGQFRNFSSKLFFKGKLSFGWTQWAELQKCLVPVQNSSAV